MCSSCQQKGLKVNWGPGMLWALLPSSSNPKSPYSNKKVREAVEYALDRPAIAKMLGFGKFEPLTQIVPSASPAYVPGYNPRPYNPEKARQLLTEAGYPSGFETKLLAIDYARDAAIAVQSYLAAVGIRVTVDVADMGRYYGALFGPAGWDDLAIASVRNKPGRNGYLRPLRAETHDLPVRFHREIARIPRFLREGIEDVRPGGHKGGAPAGSETGRGGRDGDPPVQVCPDECNA